MRKKRVLVATVSEFKCRDCVHAYDLSNKAWNGNYVLCRCKMDAESKYGEYKKLLSSNSCEHFKKKD